MQHNVGRVWRGSILPRTVAGRHRQAVQFRGAGCVDDCGRHSHRCRICWPPGRQSLHLNLVLPLGMGFVVVSVNIHVGAYSPSSFEVFHRSHPT